MNKSISMETITVGSLNTLALAWTIVMSADHLSVLVRQKAKRIMKEKQEGRETYSPFAVYRAQKL